MTIVKVKLSIVLVINDSHGNNTVAAIFWKGAGLSRIPAFVSSGTAEASLSTDGGGKHFALRNASAPIDWECSSADTEGATDVPYEWSDKKLPQIARMGGLSSSGGIDLMLGNVQRRWLAFL